MQSVLLSNPIYQHSGESQKDSCLAQQASINEEQEQRRRQLDSRGEKQKLIIAHEVAHMIDDFGGKVLLKQTPYTIPSEPILQQAQNATTNALSSALEFGKSWINSATSIASNAADKAVHLGQDAADKAVHLSQDAVHLGQDAANKAVHLGQDAANRAVHLSQDAAGYVQHLTQEAAHQASDISKKVVDTTSSAAEAVTHKTKELAEEAANKAYEIADNINHFTTLVSVLAEEENERARRLLSGDEALAAANAFRVSELIRELDPCFYKQTPNLLYKTNVLEEAERRWRLNSSHASTAENNAHNVGKLVNNNLQSFLPRYKWVRTHINSLEEKERLRRLNNADESYAIINAFALTRIISELGLGFYRQIDAFDRKHASYATTLLEELERKNRIRQEKLSHAYDSAHALGDVISNNMEKFNYNTRHAAQFATEFTNMLASATKSIASNFTALTQDFAKTAATRVKSVAGDIANYSTIMYVIALEEKERARRISDPSEINAINNAWIQSGLIRELEGLYRAGSSRAVFPLGLLEEQERRWRMASLNPAASRKLVETVVKPNLSKFALATERMAKIEHALDTAAHSKMNPNAPAFIPHMTKPLEPAPILSAPKAAGAQF